MASLLNWLGQAADNIIPGDQSNLHRATPQKKKQPTPNLIQQAGNSVANTVKGVSNVKLNGLDQLLGGHHTVGSTTNAVVDTLDGGVNHLADVIAYPIIAKQTTDDLNKGRISPQVAAQAIDQAGTKAGFKTNDDNRTILRKSGAAIAGPTLSVLTAGEAPGLMAGAKSLGGKIVRGAAGGAAVGGGFGAIGAANTPDDLKIQDLTNSTLAGAAVGGLLGAAAPIAGHFIGEGIQDAKAGFPSVRNENGHIPLGFSKDPAQTARINELARVSPDPEHFASTLKPEDLAAVGDAQKFFSTVKDEQALEQKITQANPNLVINPADSPLTKQATLESAQQQASKQMQDAGNKMFGSKKDMAKLRNIDATNLDFLEGQGDRVAESMVTKQRVLNGAEKYEVNHAGDPALENLRKTIIDAIPTKPAPNAAARAHFVEAMPKFVESVKNASSHSELVSLLNDARSRMGWSERQRLKENFGAKFANVLNGNSEAVRRAMYRPAQDFSFAEKKASTAVRDTTKPVIHQSELVPYVRKNGENIGKLTPSEVQKMFNLKGVEYGNYVKDHEAADHLTRFAESLTDLEKATNFDMSALIKKLDIGISFGSRGRPGALAHYEPTNKVINITKKDGADGSLGHELGHAIDDALSKPGRASRDYASSGNAADPKIASAMKEVMDAIKKNPDGAGIETVPFDAKFATHSFPIVNRLIEEGKTADETIAAIMQRYPSLDGTQLKRLANSIMKKTNTTELQVPRSGMSQMLADSNAAGDYWKRDTELFARTFADYLRVKGEKSGIRNNYLTHQDKQAPIMSPDMMDKIEPKMDALLATMKEHFGLADAPKRAVAQAPKVETVAAQESAAPASDYVKLYHATDKNFTTFSDAFKGSNTDANNTDLGHFFAADKAQIDEFLNSLKSGFGNQPGRDISNYKVMERYADKNKFFNLNYNGTRPTVKEAETLVQFLGTEDGKPLKGQAALDYIEGMMDEDPEAIHNAIYEDSKRFGKFMKRKGYVGVTDDFGQGKTEHVVVDPSALKTKEELAALSPSPTAPAKVEAPKKVQAATPTPSKPVQVFHGTNADFTNFENKFLGSANGTAPINRTGFNFTDNKDVAKTFGKNVKEATVDIKRPYTIDAKGQDYAKFKDALNEKLSKVDRSKYDGIVIKNYLDGGVHGDPKLGNHYIPFNESQITVKPAVPKALDSKGTQLLLSAPKSKAEAVAELGAVSPAKAKQVFKKTGVAPEVLKKNTIKQTPMVGTERGIVTKTPATANRQALKEAAQQLDIYGLGGKDKHAFKLARETPDRITHDVFGDNAHVITSFLNDPIRANESKRLAFLNTVNQGLESTFKSAGIRRNSNEDKIAFRLGEGTITEAQAREELGSKADGVIAATKQVRDLYDSMLTDINASLRHYGYPEIPKRKNYLTHIQDMGNAFEQLGNILNSDKNKLPTAMSGINMDTKPGKGYFQFANQRKGGAHKESLVSSIEAYLPGASNQIFHTDSIQRARAVQNALTDPKLRVNSKVPVGTLVTSSDRGNVGILKGVDNGTATVHFVNKTEGTEATVKLPIENLKVSNDPAQGNALSNYNSWLSEYANTLAGKKVSIDRPFEKIFGRQVLEIGSFLKRKSGANMVGGNISSALTNFIPLTQAIASTSKRSMGKGLLEATRQPFAKEPGIIDGMQSNFLANRFAKTEIKASRMDTAKEKASALFAGVDRFTSEAITRGKYDELRSKGMGKRAALKAADDYARKTIADRSVGETPIIFNSKVLGAFTQFQLEVNNQVSVILKDIPQNAKSRKQLASQLTQVVLYSYLANNLYQQVTGQRPAFDPIEYALNLKTNVEKAMGKDTTKKKIAGAVGAAGHLITDVASGLPGTSVILGGGRIPLTAGLPDPTQIVNHPIRELSKPITNYALPLGGSQIRKTVEGVSDFMKGKATDAAGKTNFTINQDGVNAAKVALFGKYADPNGQRYLGGLGISPGTAPSLSKLEQANQDIKALTDASNANGGTTRKATTGSTATKQTTADHLKTYLPNVKNPTDEQKKAANRAASADKTIAKDIASSARQTLLDYAKLDSAGKTAYNADPKKAYQLNVAQYQNDKAQGKFNPISDQKAQESLAKQKITSDYSKEVQDFYGLSKTAQSAWFARDKTKATELYAKAKELDAALTSAGIEKVSKYKYGLGTKGKKTALKNTGTKVTLKSFNQSATRMAKMTVKTPKAAKASKVAIYKSKKLPKTRTITG